MTSTRNAELDKLLEKFAYAWFKACEADDSGVSDQMAKWAANEQAAREAIQRHVAQRVAEAQGRTMGLGSLSINRFGDPEVRADANCVVPLTGKMRVRIVEVPPVRATPPGEGETDAD